MRSDPPDGERRRRTLLAGHRAEWIALIWLTFKGYRVLARRYGIRGGEIDMVLRRGPMVIFVEVKARPTRDEALAALTYAQCRRIERAAAVWLARNPWAVALTRRGDLLAIAPWRWPAHIADAFRVSAER